MTVTGPDFVALQVRDLDRAAASYETHLGLQRTSGSPPGAVAFATAPIAFALREPLPGVDLDAASPRPGLGVALWLRVNYAQTLHDELSAAEVPIMSPPSMVRSGAPSPSPTPTATRSPPTTRPDTPTRKEGCTVA